MPAVQPLLTADFTCGYDNDFHLWRAVQVASCLRQGYFYPRWAPDMAHGYGYPLFTFHPPLTAYVAALAHLAGLSWPLAVNATFALGLVLGGLFMFLLARDLFGPTAGLVAAVAYVYAPFQAYDVFNRGSLSESFAWAFLPLVLWAIHRWAVHAQRRFLFLAAFSLAGLVLTHNLFAFLFAPLLVIWVLVEGYLARDSGSLESLPRWQVMGRVVGRGALAGVLGLGLCAFFWLPGLAERGWVQTGRLLGTWVFDYHNNFLDLHQLLALPRAIDRTLVNDWPPRALGLLPTVVALVPLVRWRRLNRPTRWRAALLLASTVGFAVLTLPISLPLWERLPLLSYVQFPWRFLGPAAFCTALLAGIATASPVRGQGPGTRDQGPASIIYPPTSNLQSPTSSTLLAAILTTLLVLGNLGWFYPRHCSPSKDTSIAGMIAWERATDTLGTTAKGEYMPIWVHQMPQDPALDAAYAAGGAIARLPLESLPAGVRVLHADYGPVDATLTLDSPSPFRARYLAFYYPGWSVTVDGHPVAVAPTDPDGLVSFDVPAGSHTIRVHFGETPLRLTADVLSLLSLVALLLLTHPRTTYHASRITRSVFRVPCSVFRHATRKTHHPKPRPIVWVLLVLVLSLAACLRWVRFTEFPPGLWYDEAYTLAQAQQLAQGGEFQIYYPEKHGEPAIIWLTSLALKLGADHLAPRWVTSVSSVISVLLLFFAVYDIMRRESAQAEWLALGSAAVLSTNYEFLFHSRMSWQGALVTATFIPAVWCFWRGMRSGRYRDFIVAGAMAGASQYTGVAARLLPLVLLLVLLGWFGKDRRCWRARWKGLSIMGGVALLIYLPLANAFLAHPEWFGRRLRATAPASELLPNLGRTLAGWLWMGEAGLHSLPGRPIYDPAMGFLLLTGAALAIWKIRRPAYNVWLAWFVGVLAGDFLSAPSPMFYRTMPAVPATAALCAVGGWQIWRLAVTRCPRLRHLVLVLLLALLTASTWATCRDYFVRWAHWPRLPMVMDVWKWRAAEAILDAPRTQPLLVTIPDGLEPAISYALHARTGSPARDFDGASCLVYPNQTDRPAHYLVILGYEQHSLARLQALFPSGYQTVDPVFDDEAPYFVNFFIPPGDTVPVLGRLPAPIHYQDILLHGAYVPTTTVSAGQTFTVTLTWESLKKTSNNYTLFVHVLDGTPEAADAPLKANHDSPPCYGTEPTWEWQPGEYILDEHSLAIPPDLPAGEYLVGVGMYDSATLERLAPADTGLQTRWDEAIISSITVTAR